MSTVSVTSKRAVGELRWSNGRWVVRVMRNATSRERETVPLLGFRESDRVGAARRAADSQNLVCGVILAFFTAASRSPPHAESDLARTHSQARSRT
jgi:hypothetical protein